MGLSQISLSNNKFFVNFSRCSSRMRVDQRQLFFFWIIDHPAGNRRCFNDLGGLLVIPIQFVVSALDTKRRQIQSIVRK
jgi:hypothetical protein